MRKEIIIMVSLVMLAVSIAMLYLIGVSMAKDLKELRDFISDLRKEIFLLKEEIKTIKKKVQNENNNI